MQYNDAGRNYGYIMLHNANQKRIEETYGSKYGVKVIREIGEKIIEVIGQRAVASRTKEAYFGIIIYIDSKEKLQALTHELKENVESINQMTMDMLDQQEES